MTEFITSLVIANAIVNLLVISVIGYVFFLGAKNARKKQIQNKGGKK